MLSTGSIAIIWASRSNLTLGIGLPDTPVERSSRPVSLIAANGPVQGNKSVKLEVPELGSADEGFDVHWYSGKAPYFVTHEGKML